jgi:uncharacterized protein (TIGR03084 family)
MQQIQDFRDEVEDLHALLAAMPPAAWPAPTGFKAWTVEDILQHLHHSDLMAMASADGADAFAAFRARTQALRAQGQTNVQATRQVLGDPQGSELLALWHRTAHMLCDRLEKIPPETRMPWAGPGMGLRMFATARQMETWSHAQAIWDLLGRARPPAAPRLRNIAEIGVRTYAWTFRNRNQDPPGPQPAVILHAADGTWTWDGQGGKVEGDAVEFCQVAAQTRNIADTALRVEGVAAGAWMSLAQCFAGPPETPPAPGTRVMAPTAWS